MDCKKYYYLKLKENYFERDNVKILESVENGYIYSNIIMKLYLKALKYNGKLMMTERIPYDPSKLQVLANVLNHDIAHVKEAINHAVNLDIIEILDTGEMFMLDIQNFIGLSSNEADRKREYRSLIENKTGQMSDNSLPELEREKEIKIKKELDIDSDITEIYNAYPLRCEKRKAYTGKNTKCKVKIRKLLNKKTKDEILEIIKLYLNDCNSSGSYIKNFETFLNNIPDKECFENQSEFKVDIQGIQND